MEKIIWKIEKRKLSELEEYENNPRKLSEKHYVDLKKSIERFGLVEKPVINSDNTLIAGHQRCKILQDVSGDCEIDVIVPNRKLSKRELEEYLIRSNKNTGEWEMDLLQDKFKFDDLINWGFDDIELDFNIDVDNNKDLSNSLEKKYIIEIEVKNENEQEKLYNKLIDDGYICRILTL